MYDPKTHRIINKAIETAVHLGVNNVKLHPGKTVQRPFVGISPSQPYGSRHSFQDVKLLAFLVYGSQEQFFTLYPNDPSVDLICFDGSKPPYKGARIIELAGKDRTVSIGSAIYSVIGEYLSSQYRGILLTYREYVEGYKGSEIMEELLSRLNGTEDAKTSPIDSAVKYLLANPNLRRHVDPRKATRQRRSSPKKRRLSGNQQKLTTNLVVKLFP